MAYLGILVTRKYLNWQEIASKSIPMCQDCKTFCNAQGSLNIGWKMTLNGRQPWMEDDLGWKTTWDGIHYWWKETLDGRQPLGG